MINLTPWLRSSPTKLLTLNNSRKSKFILKPNIQNSKLIVWQDGSFTTSFRARSSAILSWRTSTRPQRLLQFTESEIQISPRPTIMARSVSDSMLFWRVLRGSGRPLKPHSKGASITSSRLRKRMTEMNLIVYGNNHLRPRRSHNLALQRAMHDAVRRPPIRVSRIVGPGWNRPTPSRAPGPAPSTRERAAQFHGNGPG